MNIEKITRVTDELVDALEQLIPQLGTWHAPPKREEMEQIVGSPGTTLLIARLPERRNEIVGTATLVTVRTPTGVRATLEDVVVDSSARGKGIGEALCRAALDYARAAGADKVDLTSHPTREAANRLYQRLGFARRDTNVYRYEFGRKGSDTCRTS
jgi:ribosomal protein S18 acetylase RimI-like enzyme